MSKIRVERKECIHILTSGPRKNLPCSKKTTLIPDTNIPSDFCSIHYNKSKEQVPTENKSVTSETQTNDEDFIVIRKNKFNNFVFGKTGLIIKSSKEKYIVAKESDNGDWLPLSEEDIEDCKRYHLKYKILDFNFKGEITNKEYIKSTKITGISSNLLNKDTKDINDFIDVDDFTDDNLK